MMSKKKWSLLLVIFVAYLFAGASFFYKVESELEFERFEEARMQRIEVLELIKKHYMPHSEQEDFLDKLGTYCGKNLINVSESQHDDPPKWDFYHSVFFSFTVVTTVGYGNLAPTTTSTRLFMIAYGLIGVPYNGILFATLGEYFGKTFAKLYQRWKTSNGKKKDFGKLGLVAQVTLYLTPGILIFMFLPAVLFMYFEDWEYDLAFYYAFVTLTTIGFGDYVAGMNRFNHKYGIIFFKIYQAFLLVWMTFGLGYLLMIIGFLTRSLRSKRMVELEKKLKYNIKKSHAKLRGGLNKITYGQRLMNEIYMAKLKPVYRDDYIHKSTPKLMSQSFPDLRLLTGEVSPTTLRRRAMSECLPSKSVTRSHSESDLGRIDKDATFAKTTTLQECELLAKVVNALTCEEENSSPSVEETEFEDQVDLGVHGFSDSDILRSEQFGSGLSVGEEKCATPPKVPRGRAASDVKLPRKYSIMNQSNEWTWSGPYATEKLKELRQLNKFNRNREIMNVDQSSQKKSWLENIRSSLKRRKNTCEDNKQLELNRQHYLERTAQGRKSTYSITTDNYSNISFRGRESVFSNPESRILEETSVGELLRAISSLQSRNAQPDPQRKLGTASLNPPSLDFYNPALQLRNNFNRASMTSNKLTRRRFSLHPVTELPQPPPYDGPSENNPSRRGSVILTTSSPAGPNPVHRQISRLRELGAGSFRRCRHDSLKDIRVEQP